MRKLVVMGLAATLAACAASEDPAAGGDKGKPANAPGAQHGEATATALPQLAYRYGLTFILPDDKIADAQESARSRCEAMGAARCQLLSLTRGSGVDQNANAALQLRVASGEARAFVDALTDDVRAQGGRATDTQVTAEDVSKAVVDTTARIRQRELYVARLTDILRTRAGSMNELLEAERKIAAAQEELDQARAWLAQLNGRIAMSEIEIDYRAAAPATDARSVLATLGDAGQGSLAAFGIGLQLLMTLALYLLPWGLLLLPGIAWLAWRRRRALPPQA